MNETPPVACRCCERAVGPNGASTLLWSGSEAVDGDVKHKAAGAVLITLCLSCCLGDKGNEEWCLQRTAHEATQRRVRRKRGVDFFPFFFFLWRQPVVQTGGREISKQVCSWWSVLWRRELERHSFWHSLLTRGLLLKAAHVCSVCLSCADRTVEGERLQEVRQEEKRAAPGA